MCLWVYTGSISLWGVWYLRWKSTPKKWMSSFEDFGFLEDFENEEIGVTLKTLILMRGLWSMKTFFRSFIFSFLSHRKHRTVNGDRGKTKETFPSDAHLKAYTYPTLSSEAIGNLIQFNQFLQWQRRRSSVLFEICSNWGVRNSPVRIANKWGTWQPWGIWDLQFSPLLCYTPAAPNILST